MSHPSAVDNMGRLVSLGNPANDRTPNVRPVGYSHTTSLTLPPLKSPTISLPLLNPASGSREVKRAIELLSLARVVAKVHFSDCTGIPLESRIDDRTFKALFLDIGLVCTSLGINAHELATLDDSRLVNQGALAEQFVGQHLLYGGEPYQEPRFAIGYGKANATMLR